MGEFVKQGELVEGKKCQIIARKVVRGSIKEDPITNQNMVVYELDLNCSVEVIESLSLSKEEVHLRKKLGVHGNVGDLIKGKSIKLYVDNRRGVRFKVIEGVSGRHGANVANPNVRTIGIIKTPLDIYRNLLGYSAKSNNKMVENN